MRAIRGRRLGVPARSHRYRTDSGSNLTLLLRHTPLTQLAQPLPAKIHE
ncbi:hypothetical protein SAMN05216288_1212 [Pseudomonas punonensis]|uniref:Uncharacterized protein n=1 Tax=Phytopseudomonas punonensis TaxID=1220495 RepID=A0A1M6YDA7_9GAMM|nr:hypothetical protein SAMN05216288_1212 [Pseudomonas punonensis]